MTAIQTAYCEEMKNFYNSTAYTHEYMFGFLNGNDLMMAILNWADFRNLLVNDRAATSKGGMLKIRVRANARQKAALMRKAIKVGTAADLTADKKHNRGENFERIVTENIVGEKWSKDSVPYTEAGDVVYRGIAYQIKLDSAELTNAKTYENFKARLA